MISTLDKWTELANRIEAATGADPRTDEYENVFQGSIIDRCERCREVTATALLIDGEDGENIARLCIDCCEWF